MTPGRARDFSLLQNVLTSSGAYPAAYSIGTWVLFLGIKWQGHVVDHSSPSKAEVKSEWIYTSASLYSYVVRHRDSFTFYQK